MPLIVVFDYNTNTAKKEERFAARATIGIFADFWAPVLYSFPKKDARISRRPFDQKMTSHSGRAKQSMLMSCMLRGLPERRRLLSVVRVMSACRELI